MIVSLGLPVMYAGGIFNCAALVVDGKIIGLVAKQHLAGDGIHYEPRWFKPWPAGIHGEIEIGDQTYPIGDILFNVGGIRIGFEICEDAWVGTRPGASLAERGADIILNPSASHFAFDKHEVRKRFVLEGSRAFNVSYIYSNLTGNESGRAIFDGDAMIASGGNLLACGERLSFRPSMVTSAVLNIESTRMTRARTGSFVPDIDGEEDDVIHAEFSYPDCALQRAELVKSDWEQNTEIKAEEFTRAVCLGLFDYLRKSWSRGFIVSLSGGCDSSSIVALIRCMLELSVDELGFDGVIERLKFCIPGVTDGDIPADVDELNRRLLTTAYQSTRNSGDVTRNAASELAAAVSATHYEFDVDSQVQDYRTTISNAIGEELTWEKHDIALQNIQAEAAVGYATMDGDTSGGLSPIAGIDKAYLREWLRWMETTGPVGGSPIPALKLVNDQQPTAELLDAIECFAIRDKMVPIEVFDNLKVDFAQFTPAQLGAWTIRFFRLWCRNQWKRERYAPSFHLDDKNLDPKTWCRFPILSGGFKREIQELETLLKSTSA